MIVFLKLDVFHADLQVPMCFKPVAWTTHVCVVGA
jgi:hypothetical protein